jgi:membrane-associated HD superfamily phosphohydrolase
MRHNILEQIIRWGLFVIGVVALMGLFTFGGVSDYPDLRLNSIAPRKIIAPFDFEILKLEEKLEKERKEARAAVPPVFVPADKAVVSRSLTQLDSILYDL